jgi:hypothetical protein
MNQNVKSLDLPESIHRILFVEKLSEAVHNPVRTATTYVVTPPLAEAFDKTLRIVSASLRDLRSRAAFLHGSFGSDKSHFMAMMSLLLEGNEEAWRFPELHGIRPRHTLLRRSSSSSTPHDRPRGEEAIFGTAHVRTHTWGERPRGSPTISSSTTRGRCSMVRR